MTAPIVLYRLLVSWAALIVFGSLLGSASAAPQGSSHSQAVNHADPSPAGITGVFVDVAHIHHDEASNGDTWDFAWANDGNIYTFADDSRGYGHVGRNVNFNKLVGGTWDGMTGSSVNTMDAYGTGSQQFPNGATWKTTGCDCIDGVLYAFIANNWYGDHRAYGVGAVDPYLRQTVLNMSLLKSTDHGKTWTRSETDNYDHPMWTNPKFSTAYFFKFGQNGGRTTQDGQDRYVYALSNDGYWNDGTNLYLGRVLRAQIGALRAADWQYYDAGKWTADVNAATPIPGFPNGQVKCASGSPIWLAALHKYVTVTWYNPEPADTRKRWDFPADRIFDFYQADHPWGPWSIIGEKKATDFIADPHDPIHRWYGPSFSPKFVTNNPDGSVTAILTFAGQTWEDSPDSLYKCNSCPVTFFTTPQPRLLQWTNDNDAGIAYSDGWDYQANRGKGDYDDDLHLTSLPGSTIDFSFQGSGIELLSEKSSSLGAMEVVIDGQSAGTVSQRQDPFPLLYQIPIFRRMDLTNGLHTVRIIDRAPAGTAVTFDGYKVYSDAAVPTNPPRTAPVPAGGTKYEAEAGIYGSTDVYQDPAASGGAGARHLDVAVGSGVKFTHIVAGAHLLIRYCTDYDLGKLSLYVNGTKVQDVTFPKTGGWDSAYRTVSVPVTIPAGAEIKLQYDAGDVAANIDDIVVY